jgi:tRNA pseudouridine38-40 synthase
MDARLAPIARLTIAYIGTRWAGWQRQENAPTVQQAVEEALADLVGEPVALAGASRTDAGVHARAQEAHFELRAPLPLRALVHGLNHRLPGDVRVMAAHAMPEGFHARFSAEAKEYLYRLVRAETLSPFVAPYAVRAPRRLDLEALRAAAAVLLGEHDFTAFALSGGAHRQPRRTLFFAAWEEEGEELRLRLRGDGFLRGMVRALVGTLLEVGEGKRRVEDFAALLGGAARGAAGPTAPARGLTLEQVFYPQAMRPLASWPPRHRGLPHGLW